MTAFYFFEGGVALIALRTDALRTFYFLNSSRMRSSHGDIVCELISDESEAALIIIVIIICWMETQHKFGAGALGVLVHWPPFAAENNT